MKWDDELERRTALAQKKCFEQVARANAEFVEAVRQAVTDYSEGLPADPEDELEALVSRVIEHFGKDVFRQAMERALTHALLRTNDDGLIASGVFEDAMRTELQRLARVQ